MRQLINDEGVNQYASVRTAYDRAKVLLTQEKPDRKELSDLLEKKLKSAFKSKKISRLHGSRDYFQIKENDFTTEIIPILDIKKAEQAEKITDVSPLHAEWVNKKGKSL